LTKKTLASSPLVGAVLCGVLAVACTDEPPARDPPSANSPAAEASDGARRAPICCLHPGDVVAGTLSAAAGAAYAFDLAAGDVLEVVADQQAGDVVLVVEDPDGGTVQRWDTPVGRREPEHLFFTAEAPGRYGLGIEAPQATSPTPYRVSVAALGRASAATRERARAAMAVAAAHELRRGGKLEPAAERYAEGAAAWAALEEPASAADALDWRATCLRRLGRHEEAITVLERAIEGFRSSDDVRREARARADLGTSLRQLGRIDEAVASFEAAVPAWRKAEDPAGEAAALTQLANLQKARGELSAAELRYQQAIHLWESLDRRRDQAITLANLAGLYTVVGHADVALDLLQRAREVLPPDAERGDKAFLLEEQGVAHQKLGERDEAVAAFRRALSIRREDEETEDGAAALDGLARLHYDAGEYDQAADLYREARALAHSQRDRLREASIVESLGWVELRRGRPRRALPLFQSVLPVLRELDFPAGEVAALAGIARVERALGHTEAAATWAERSLEVLEELRAGSDRPELRASLLATRQDYFDFAVDTLMELHRRHPDGGFDAEAFAVSERGRARWLLDALPGPEPEPDGADRAALEPLRQAVNEAASRRLRRLDDGASRDELARAERELRETLEDLRRADARRRSAQGPETGAAPRPLSLDQVQHRLLDPQTLLLSYDLGEERSYLFAVTDATMETFVLPAGKSLGAEARALHRVLAHSDEAATGSQAELRAARLSEALLRPVAGVLARHRRLLVIPDGALHAIPFGVLPDPASGGPLLERHEVVHAPSSSVVAWLDRRPAAERRGPARKLLAMIADPVFGPEDERVTPEPGAPARPSVPETPPIMGGPDLPRLPHAADEAEAVAQIARPGGVLSARDFGAEKELVKTGALSSYRILHFATHGWFSSEYPELSALVLSRVDEHGHPKDGVLWAHEIAGLDLSADLVVLSACDTGLGAEIGGEGLVGLTHAFFRAGAPRVLASLWRVDDQAAVDLMTTFYRGYLDDGLSPAESLRRAQLAVRADPRWQRPFFWAGFVLQGRR
jgi:CHAT domain-containing protein/Tfp pilus assembly protein PilF